MKNKRHFVNENWLHTQIESLNQWLVKNIEPTKARALTIIKRNYYESKLIELDNSHLNCVQL